MTLGPFTVTIESIGDDDYDLIIEHPDGWTVAISTGGDGQMNAYATFLEIPWGFDIYTQSGDTKKRIR